LQLVFFWQNDMQRLHQHCAHIRAIAASVPLLEALLRYPAFQHGRASLASYRRDLEAVKTIARRNGDTRWRLIGLDLPKARALDAPRSLPDWAEAHGPGDWSHADLLAMYSERFEVDERERRRSVVGSSPNAVRLATSPTPPFGLRYRRPAQDFDTSARTGSVCDSR
jgi:hypothetical protein